MKYNYTLGMAGGAFIFMGVSTIMYGDFSPNVLIMAGILLGIAGHSRR